MGQGALARTHEASPGLPRGRGSLPAPEVSRVQREKLLTAVVAAVAERGIGAVTIADIVRRAKVSRAAFYAHFEDKEQCLRAASSGGWLQLVEAVLGAAAAVAPDASPEEEWRAGCRAYLRFLASEPAFTRVFYIEMPAAGPGALQDVDDALRQFAEINRDWHERARAVHPEWPRVPAAAYLALAGAAKEMISAYVRGGRTERLPELEDDLAGLHLAVMACRPWVERERSGTIS